MHMHARCTFLEFVYVRHVTKLDLIAANSTSNRKTE